MRPSGVVRKSLCTCGMYMYISWKLHTYKKTYYEICTYAYVAILQTITWCKAYQNFGAKWQGTFEATALVW